MSESAARPTVPTPTARTTAEPPSAGGDPGFLDSWRSASRPRATPVALAAATDASAVPNARLLSRRRFAATLTLAALAVAASGFWRFGGGQRSLAGIADGEILPSEKLDYASLDDAFRRGKVGAIQAILQSAPTAETATISRWIAHSGEPSLHPLLVALLSNPAFEVRVRALTDLKTIPPVMLKPEVPALIAVVPFESDEVLREKIQKLIRTIQNA